MPSILISEFTEMTSGLVSNAALQAFATLRNNTYQILAKFHSGMDAPFLAHRLMLPEPSDANELLAFLVGSEITSLLEGKDVGWVADKYNVEKSELNFLNSWLEKFKYEKPEWWKSWNSLVRKGTAKKKNIVEIVYKLLSESGDSSNRINSLLMKPEQNVIPVHSSLPLHTLEVTKKFTLDEAEADNLDKEFAYLTTVSSFYKEKPFLRFGTILAEIKENGVSYWLCVQPSCDCLRISGKRKFPLLKLKRFDPEKNSKFDLVILENGKYERVSISYRPYESDFVEFKSDTKKKRVNGTEENETFFFESAGEKKRKFKWLGELKFAPAQRVANEYAAKFSRVGLDESEWLRRWATDGSQPK